MINPVGSGANVNAAFDLNVTADVKLEQIKPKSLMSTGPAETQGSGKETSTDTTETPVVGTKLSNSGETGKRIGSVSMVDTISVMFMAAQQQRELGSKDRQMALEANVQNLLASADKLKEAAEKRRDGAIAAAVGQIVGGVISGLGAGMSVWGGMKDWASDTQLEIFTGATSKISGMFADASTGGGKIREAELEYQAGTLTAQSKKDDAMAALHEKKYQEANDFRENAKQAQSAVMDYVRALAQSQVETEKAIARNL